MLRNTTLIASKPFVGSYIFKKWFLSHCVLSPGVNFIKTLTPKFVPQNAGIKVFMKWTPGKESSEMFASNQNVLRNCCSNMIVSCDNNFKTCPVNTKSRSVKVRVAAF